MRATAKRLVEFFCGFRCRAHDSSVVTERDRSAHVRRCSALIPRINELERAWIEFEDRWIRALWLSGRRGRSVPESTKGDRKAADLPRNSTHCAPHNARSQVDSDCRVAPWIQLTHEISRLNMRFRRTDMIGRTLPLSSTSDPLLQAVSSRKNNLLVRVQLGGRTVTRGAALISHPFGKRRRMDGHPNEGWELQFTFLLFRSAW